MYTQTRLAQAVTQAMTWIGSVQMASCCAAVIQSPFVRRQQLALAFRSCCATSNPGFQHQSRRSFSTALQILSNIHLHHTRLGWRVFGTVAPSKHTHQQIICLGHLAHSKVAELHPAAPTPSQTRTHSLQTARSAQRHSSSSETALQRLGDAAQHSQTWCTPWVFAACLSS